MCLQLHYSVLETIYYMFLNYCVAMATLQIKILDKTVT